MENLIEKKSYILRDVIHSDILFEDRFFSLINTSEFQRLARIKQLSCEYLVFPSALHNRFSHSVGTYYVMGQLIQRLEKVLKAYHVEVTPEQKDLALCSALLHDIGHGPFSHTFERISSLGSHETWTAKILLDENTQIHQALVANFPPGFVDKLIHIIDGSSKEEDTILTLISQLISSQMDADRMDYLLRDSYFTGVSTGLYDLHRLIEALDVARVNGSLKICVSEKYISSIEEYIMARFYMHKEAYQHPLKRQLEHIIHKIFARAKELWQEEQDIFVDEIMGRLFKGEITVSDYLTMDDSFLMYHVAKWRYNEDMILSALCKAFVDRKKFMRYRKTSEETLYDLLNQKMGKKGLKPIHWENQYCYIYDRVQIPIYDRQKDNIWVKLRSQQVVDITEASYIFGNMDMSQKFVRTNEYIHEDMLNQLFGIQIKE